MSTSEANDESLGRLYDSLSRFQWWMRGSRHANGAALDMHKALAAPDPGTDGPEAGTAGIHEWAFSLLGVSAGDRILDLGSGFGATGLDWVRRTTLHYTGLSLSAYQIRKAKWLAAKAGCTDRLEFRRQSFDDPVTGRFDKVVSIETLFHAPQLAETVSRIATVLEPGGRFLLVEDMATGPDVAETSEGRSLLRRWSTARLHGVADFQRALETAGLSCAKQVDLSPQVVHREVSARQRAERRLHFARRLAPLAGLRRVVDAFLGGFDLERLYAAGKMRYMAMLASKPETGA